VPDEIHVFAVCEPPCATASPFRSPQLCARLDRMSAARVTRSGGAGKQEKASDKTAQPKAKKASGKGAAGKGEEKETTEKKSSSKGKGNGVAHQSASITNLLVAILHLARLLVRLR
jgi:hypothetical protein